MIFLLKASQFKEIKCHATAWGFIKKQTWYFSEEYWKHSNRYNCYYRSIKRVTDQRIIKGNWIGLSHNQTIKDEVFEVLCTVKKELKNKYFTIGFSSLFIQIINKLGIQDKTNERKLDEIKDRLDIILLSYDSVSRPAWLQRLPITNKFIFETMKFEMLKGYNIIGDGTPGKLNIFLNFILNSK